MKKRYNKFTRIGIKTAIVSCDLGKTTHWCYMRSVQGGESNSFKIANDRKGFDYLWHCIQDFQCAHDLDEVVFGYESTGNYGLPLLYYLKDKGVRLIQVNPKHTKRLKELSDNSQLKSDQKDPRVIADILQLNHGLHAILPEGIVAQLRGLVHTREDLLIDINRVKNRIESKVTLLFPEFLELMKGLKSKSSIYLLRHYPDPRQIINLGPKRLSRHLRRVSRSRLGAQRARALWLAAKQTVGIQAGQSAHLGALDYCLAQLELLESQLEEVEQAIEQACKDLPLAKLLCTMDQIGPVTAATVLSEIVSFRAFGNAKQIIKLAGLNLYEISSGKHRGKKRISKQGRPLLRRTLYFAALRLIKKDAPYHDQYQKHLANGMESTQAIIAIAKKLIRVMFAMVKYNRPFNANYEQLQKMAA